MQTSLLTGAIDRSAGPESAKGDPVVEYVVLDPALQHAAPQHFQVLFEEFVAGYTRNFAGDEAESSSAWLARIDGEPLPQPLMRIVVAIEHSDGRERVLGGAACEYYRASGCMLVTYLYVSGHERRRGHARALLAAAGSACAALGPLRAMLAESEWPELLQAGGASPATVAAARRRLGFFARVDARLLNFDYVQPALGPGQRPVAHLRLFALPLAPATEWGESGALAHATDAFLAEFYAALGGAAEGSAGCITLEEMRRQVSGRRPLLIPLPRLHLDDAALCFHFVEELDATAGSSASLEAIRQRKCRVLHSMETDLLSRAYRVPRLFRTVCLTQPMPPAAADGDAGIEVTMRFPRRLTFQSENRVEERQWPLRSRVARAYLAASFFFDARVVVWHLTLKVDPDAPADDARRWLDELDLIALLKLADDGADQEFVRVPAEGATDGRGIAGCIGFGLANQDTTLDLNGLLQAVAARAKPGCVDLPTPRPPSCARAATVQLLGWKMDDEPPFVGIGDSQRREALCGVVTSILDFDEIDDSEVRDTLTPAVGIEHAMLCVHRANLVYVAEDDRAARTVAGTVGLSPYLIIPQATMLCDEWLMQRVEALALSVRANDPIGSMSAVLKKVESLMRRRWVPNPFFYPTEQTLYERALQEGGTTARRAKAEELLLELKTRLHLKGEAQRAKFEAIIAGLLGAISVLSLDALIMYFTPWMLALLGGAAADRTFFSHTLTIGAAVVIGFFIGLWKWPPSEAE